MRDRDAIDAELRRIAALRRSVRERSAELASRQLDALLDERLGHCPEVSETEAVVARRLPGGPYRYDSVLLRRFGRLAALPLSLLAVAAVLAVVFAAHRPQPVAQPAEVPPPDTPASAPPSAMRPGPTPPEASAPPLGIADRVFIDALKHEGVPVPSQEYAITRAHAVCDFLAQQPNFADAVDFVQRSSPWDTDQSTEFTAGAIASYCPESRPAGSDAMQQTLQNILADLQAIQGRLEGIRDRLPAVPGQP